MLKMFLDHARVQVAQAAKDFEKTPRQQTSKRRSGDFYLLYISMRKEDVIAGRT